MASVFGFSTLFTETLTGAGEIGLPNYTYRESNANFTATRGGTGVTFTQAAADTAGAYADGQSARVVTVGDSSMEGLLLFTAQATNEQFVGMWLRGNGAGSTRFAQDDTCFWAEAAQTTNQIRIVKFVAGAPTIVGSAAKVWTAADWYLRFAVVGDALYARAWLASGSEPGAWDIQISGASAISSGSRFGFGFNGGNSGVVTYTQLAKTVEFYVSAGRRAVYRRF